MRPIALALLVCVLLCSGCWGTRRHQPALPDPAIPHRVAQEAVVVVWVRRADGTLVPEPVRLLPGWWVAAPQVVE